MNNILIVSRPLSLGRAESNAQGFSRRHGSSLPPPLEKYANSTDEDMDNKAIINLPATSNLPTDASYLSSQLINDHIKELQVFFTAYCIVYAPCNYCSFNFTYSLLLSTGVMAIFIIFLVLLTLIICCIYFIFHKLETFI